MTTRQKQIIAGVAGVAVLAGGAFFLAGGKDAIEKIPGVREIVEEPECPLTSAEPRNESLVERPAVGVKIENSSVAYPLSGLEDAEVVYEEPAEGGLTRFLAIYHCTDAAKAGPVRSSRVVDPPILIPYTRIMAAAGGNDIVRQALTAAELVLIDEDGAGDAMSRIDRPGIGSEHTLYADTAALRRLGRKQYSDPPEVEFEFGDIQDGAKKARTISITFSAGATVRYDWADGAWQRFDNDQALLTEAGDQITADNVIIEEHTVNFSTSLGDVLGTPSPEIADVTGSGRALLFRDGRVVRGRWSRDDETSPVTFESNGGDEFVLAPGRTWIELVPDDKGDLKGSFSFDK